MLYVDEYLEAKSNSLLTSEACASDKSDASLFAIELQI